jgi:hypothetical protein
MSRNEGAGPRAARPAKLARAAAATASFTVSWDGRLVDPPPPADNKRLRKLAAAGLVPELRLTFRPCILGGQCAPPITGLGKAFLPRGKVLRLLKLERTPGGITASYRLQPP